MTALLQCSLQNDYSTKRFTFFYVLPYLTNSELSSKKVENRNPLNSYITTLLYGNNIYANTVTA